MKKNSRKVTIYALLLSIVSLCGAISVKSFAAPMVGPTPTTLTALDFLVKSYLIYVNYDYRLAGNNEWVKFGSDSTYRKIFNLLEIDYGFEKNWTVRIIAPVNYESQKFDTSYTKFSAGSVIFDTKYNMYNPRKEMGFVGTFYLEFSPIIGVRLPTGDKSAFFSPTKSSTDLEFGGLARIGDSKGALYLSFVYWSNGLLSKEDAPDEIYYNATIEMPAIINRFVLLTELDGLASTAKDKHYSLRLYPELQCKLYHNVGPELYQKVAQEFSLDIAVAFPLVEKGAFKYDFAPYVGWHWRF